MTQHARLVMQHAEGIFTKGYPDLVAGLGR